MTNPSTELEPGTFVTPAIRLVRLLGEGGMGTVWLAEHGGLGAEVVVKVIGKSVEGRADVAARFAAEAAAAASIKSPHVVTVFDYGVTESGAPYIVMERLEGRDLAAHLAVVDRMPLAEVVCLVVQVARALTKAHRAGVVHRDIKPENIFLCRQDEEDGDVAREPIFVKLLDFGTAKTSTDVGPSSRTVTSPGELLGTPYYMSPEQIASAGEVDLRTDVWSFGVVVFEALTGKKPFDGGTVAGITLAIHGVPPRMTDVVPELPIALDAWFAKACAQDPAERYASARDAAAAFVEVVTGASLGEYGESARIPALSPRPGSVALSPSRGATDATDVAGPRPRLIETLPKRGAERRPILVAAGIVAALAGLTMAGVVAGMTGSSSPAPVASSSKASPAETTAAVAKVAPPKAEVAKTEAAKTEADGAKAEAPKVAAGRQAPSDPDTGTSSASGDPTSAPVNEAAKAAAKEPKRAPSVTPPATREARVPRARRGRKADAPHESAAHEDDDLVHLSNIDPGPSAAPAAPPAKAPDAPAPPSAPVLPNLPSEPAP